MNALIVDEGVLLTKENPEFSRYAVVYDKNYGYYDENQYYILSEQDAIAQARQYVESGVENTYAIVSKTILDDGVDPADCIVCFEDYSASDVVYSVAKLDGQIVEGFVAVPEKTDWFEHICQRLIDSTGRSVRWDGDEMMLCRTESAADAIADLLEQLYRSQGEEVVINTGFYEPEEDKRYGTVDDYTGWWYVKIDG